MRGGSAAAVGRVRERAEQHGHVVVARLVGEGEVDGHPRVERVTPGRREVGGGLEDQSVVGGGQGVRAEFGHAPVGVRDAGGEFGAPRVVEGDGDVGGRATQCGVEDVRRDVAHARASSWSADTGSAGADSADADPAGADPAGADPVGADSAKVDCNRSRAMSRSSAPTIRRSVSSSSPSRRCSSPTISARLRPAARIRNTRSKRCSYAALPSTSSCARVSSSASAAEPCSRRLNSWAAPSPTGFSPIRGWCAIASSISAALSGVAAAAATVISASESANGACAATSSTHRSTARAASRCERRVASSSSIMTHTLATVPRGDGHGWPTRASRASGDAAPRRAPASGRSHHVRVVEPPASVVRPHDGGATPSPAPAAAPALVPALHPTRLRCRRLRAEAGRSTPSEPTHARNPGRAEWGLPWT
ncbi:hypothetical protein FRIGORI9N_450129 [Frigoribacterium sp. 9N]|nr:hypothetical protein FRIGORI9N_450129 [Frigoribacterium sp. 9N]